MFKWRRLEGAHYPRVSKAAIGPKGCLRHISRLSGKKSSDRLFRFAPLQIGLHLAKKGLPNLLAFSNFASGTNEGIYDGIFSATVEGA